MTIPFLLFTSVICRSQTVGCIEQNSRITYSQPGVGLTYINTISETQNYFTGAYNLPGDTGIILTKTSYDLPVFSKKFRSTERELSAANIILIPPDSSILVNSASYATGHYYLSRFSKTGNLLWAKKYNLLAPAMSVDRGNQTNYTTVYHNNGIYIMVNFVSPIPNQPFFRCVARLDLWGNIVWSKCIYSPIDNYSFLANPPIFKNDTLLVLANMHYFSGAGPADSTGIIVTNLNTINGNIFSSYMVKTLPHPFAKGITAYNSIVDTLRNICVVGVTAIAGTNGLSVTTAIPFSLTLPESGSQPTGRFYSYNYAQTRLAPPSKISFSMNKMRESVFLLTDAFKNISYLLELKENIKIKNTQFFSMFNTLESAVFLTESGNKILGHNFTTGGIRKFEYLRINKNYIPRSLSCLTRDTTIFQENILPLTKDTFAWPHEINGLLTQTPFSLTEIPFTNSEDIICREVSICDTVKIKGPIKFCLPNDTATFTIHKNSQCLRKTEFIADPNAIQLLQQINDTIIKVKFLKPYNGYIKVQFKDCVLADSILIEVTRPAESLSLGNDVYICPGKSVTLRPNSRFKTYRWQDASTADSLLANTPGQYSIQVTDSCDNTFMDTIYVQPSISILNINFSPSICQFDSAYIFLNSAFTNYHWTPFSPGIIQNNILKIFPETTTLYTIIGNSPEGCELTDTLLVKVKNCPIYFYVPNSFTPNNDGKNDQFKPLISGPVSRYSFKVYNRLGENVFSTSDLQKGWAGQLKGKEQDSGVFIWVCSYQFSNDKPILKKGTVLLIR
ncbi:MAG: gliding motility-associated C-terminal domain-containing protein [Sphingobacteriales bacterium]|nr:MAG: gliding motility-associated C-terminal domain-containing protein [Sphingobacteriales bacterium]